MKETVIQMNLLFKDECHVLLRNAYIFKKKEVKDIFGLVNSHRLNLKGTILKTSAMPRSWTLMLKPIPEKILQIFSVCWSS